VQGIVAFFFVAVAVRLLGADEYGLFRQVAQILAIAAQIGLVGFQYSALRSIAAARATGDPGEVRGSAWTALVGSFIASAIVFLAIQIWAGSIAAGFADGETSRSELAGLIRLGAGFVPLFALTQVLRYCTQAYKTMVPSVLVGNIAQPLIRLAVAMTLILAGFGVRGVVVAMLVGSAAALGLAFILFRRMLTPEERRALAHSDPRAMTRFALLQGIRERFLGRERLLAESSQPVH
jgi:O-antigen/teichoic acid export membrane protein